MKKGFKKIILGTMLAAFSIAPLTGCSIFGDDGYTITDIQTRYDASTGNVIVMISTTSEENPLITFTIPQGISGKDGVSIVSVDPVLNAEGTELTITIKYSDPSFPDTVITVPVINGEDGKGIKDFNVGQDKNGNVTVEIVYTDGTTDGPFIIPKGENGVGIASIEPDYTDPDNVIVTIYYTDSSIDPTVVLIPKGVGITSITYDAEKSTDDEYVLKIQYSNGRTGSLSIPRPKSSEWHVGLNDPDIELGKDGDFYLDQLTGYVWQKKNGEWIFILSMKGTASAVSYNVRFFPSEGVWSDGTHDTFTYRIGYGEYIDLEDIPTPVRDNYVFTGWFTTNDNNPNAGQFTDLTPVLKDMNLYPRWVEEV